jgi:hypothetical protein
VECIQASVSIIYIFGRFFKASHRYGKALAGGIGHITFCFRANGTLRAVIFQGKPFRCISAMYLIGHKKPSCFFEKGYDKP